MIGIYKITSPTGKVYVGQSLHILRRFSEYRNLSNCHEQHKLYNSLVKYSSSEHIFEVIEECAIEVLNERERHWQDFYNVLGANGLNCKLTHTNDKSGKLSDDTKAILRECKLGNKASDETKLKMRLSKLGKRQSQEHVDLRTNKNKGQKRTDEQKAAMSKSKKGKANCKKRIKVNQYSLDGVFILQHPSIKHASIEIGISPSGIHQTLIGNYSQSGGFIWKYSC